jgi:hypothetical protein
MRLPGLLFLPVLCLWVGSMASDVRAADTSEEPRPLFVEGYAGRVSYAPGDELAKWQLEFLLRLLLLLSCWLLVYFLGGIHLLIIK